MRMMFVGDINLGEYYTGFGHGPKSFAEKNLIFSEVKDLLVQADYVLGNLEAPITSILACRGDPEDQVLRAPACSAAMLRDAGFSALQIANNHMVQHGKDIFNETVELLSGAGIDVIGKVAEPHVVALGGMTFAFFAASDVPDNTNKSQTQYQRLDEDFLLRVERAAKNFDHVVVMLHWGLEESTVPLLYQRKLASRLKAAGVRAIVGAHPHLFYEVEVDESFVCAYSLGNFVFDLCWDSRMLQSGVLDITFTKENISCRIWPIKIKEEGCLPTIVGEPLEVKEYCQIYNHGSPLKWPRMKKTISFWLNIYKGDTTLKLKFFINKILRLISLK
jgi:poly-gamma-glutamate capsule biosynthesis protein CapA/YwtB (metallophosphatase superfamily)